MSACGQAACVMIRVYYFTRPPSSMPLAAYLRRPPCGGGLRDSENHAGWGEELVAATECSGRMILPPTTRRFSESPAAPAREAACLHAARPHALRAGCPIS